MEKDASSRKEKYFQKQMNETDPKGKKQKKNMDMECDTKEEIIFLHFLPMEENEEKPTKVDFKEVLEEHSYQKHAQIKKETDIETIYLLERPIKLEEKEKPTEPQYELRLQKNYAVTSERNYPEDAKTLFEESCLDFEKQKFFQSIFNDILKKSNQRKIEDLQKDYVDHLRSVSEIGIFHCLSCDYKTMNKLNLKSHLVLVHELDLEISVPQCVKCEYKSKSLSDFKKHACSTTSDSNNRDEIEVPIVTAPTILECDFCPFKVSDRQSFDAHNATHLTKEGKFKCYVCDYEIWSRTKLKKHLLEKHNIPTLDMYSLDHKDDTEINWFSCTECKFKTKYKNSLNLHILAVHRKQLVKKFLCEICSYAFATRRGLNRHTLTHKSIDQIDEVFLCDQCPHKSKRKSDLKSHMAVHNPPDLRLFVCETCGFQTKRKWNFDHHVLLHKDGSNVKIYSCDVCEYRTKFRDRFTQHVKRGTHKNHETKTTERTTGTGEFRAISYNCLACNFEAASKKGFLDHIKSHDNPEDLVNKCFACSHCDYRHHNKGNLVAHSITHKSLDEIKIYECSEEGCGFQTKYQSSLDYHIKTHKGIQRHRTLLTCEVCGFQSKGSYHHKMHVLTHKSTDEVEVFSCSVCSYQTKFKTYLKEHCKKRHNIIMTKNRTLPKKTEK